MTRRKPALALLVAAFALAAPTSVLAGGANHKTFAEKISVDADPGSGGGGVAGPVALTAGAHSLFFTITNTSSGSSAVPFGSAQLHVPSWLTSATVPPLPHGPSNFTAGSPSGGFVTIVSSGSTGTGILPGKSLVVEVDVVVPSSATCATDTIWTTRVKQSNDFSGSGNDFAGNSVETDMAGGHQLVYTPQPGDVQWNSGMTVVVTDQDACGATIDYNGSVSLTDTAGLLSSTPAPVNAVHGVATFTGLTFSTYEFDDAFSATAAGDGMATCAATDSCRSHTFHVYQKLVSCAQGQSCSTGTVNDSTTTQDGSTTTTASIVGGAGPADKLTVSVKGDPSNPACDASGELPYGSLVTFNALLRTKTVTQVLPRAYVNAISNNGTPFMDICLSVPAPEYFFAKGDVLQQTPVQAGLLPDCPVPNGFPCVVSRNKKAGDEIIVFTVPAGDPHSSIY